jgi:hypothetical protein
MPVYHIVYNTHNSYSSRVREAVLDFLVLPTTSNDQEILEVTMESNPEVKPFSGKNLFGFDFLRFRLKNINEFSFTIKATVKKEVTNPYGFIPLPFDEEQRMLGSDDFTLDNYPYLHMGELTRLPPGFDYPRMDKFESVFDFVKRINQFVNNTLVYDTNIVDPFRKLDQTILEKCGVCQDYAHLMLAIMRQNNIPSRYVSGYLNQGGTIVGAGAVHAWVQVLVPGIGWIGFDPTNNLLEDHQYIKIAHGVEIGDCTTLKGVIKGAGTNQTNYRVLVEEQNKREAEQ